MPTPRPYHGSQSPESARILSRVSKPKILGSNGELTNQELTDELMRVQARLTRVENLLGGIIQEREADSFFRSLPARPADADDIPF